MTSNYPLSDFCSLKEQFVGKKLNNLPTPSIVLDRSLAKKNCAAMLQVCKKLGVGFRAHVKSHKTIELSKLMVGDGLEGLEGPEGLPAAAHFITSTLAEGEHLASYVGELQQKGREASVSLQSWLHQRGLGYC